MTDEFPRPREWPSQDALITIIISVSEQWKQKAETIETEFRLLEGNWNGKVIFEIDYQKEGDKYNKEIHRRGARIFHTEDDTPLVVHSEESLKFKEEIRSFSMP